MLQEGGPPLARLAREADSCGSARWRDGGQVRRGPVGAEKETQRRSRSASEAHATLGQIYLEGAHVLCHCRVGRAAEEFGKQRNLADIVVLGLLTEPADGQVFEHAAANVTDGILAYRGPPVLRFKVPNPSILKTERGTSSHPFRSLATALPRHQLARSALPRERVRSLHRTEVVIPQRFFRMRAYNNMGSPPGCVLMALVA
jgi:hypothetical protein